MSKTDNLTDFLTGLADKLRSVLGIDTPIEVQSFEEKIDQAYAKGKADAQGSSGSSSPEKGEEFYYSLPFFLVEY